MRSVIIEDEERNRIVLQSLLETYCPEVQCVGYADSVRSGVKLIQSTAPELIFMDIQLIGGTGFDILEKVDGLTAHVIFVTAYDQYAIKAFKFSAIDYIMKPIDIDDLRRAVQKATIQSEQTLNRSKLEVLITNLKESADGNPIMLVSTIDTIEFVKINEIIRLEAQGSYTKIYMEDKKCILASKVIKEFEYLLTDHSFYRVHQSHIIHVKSIKKYLKTEHKFQLIDGTVVQLARSRKEQFFELLKHIGKG